MASVIDRGNGRRAIQFENQSGDRKTVGLGKCPKRDAEAIKTRIEALVASKISEQPLTVETAEWVSRLPENLANKLAEFGLIQRVEMNMQNGPT